MTEFNFLIHSTFTCVIAQIVEHIISSAKEEEIREMEIKKGEKVKREELKKNKMDFEVVCFERQGNLMYLKHVNFYQSHFNVIFCLFVIHGISAFVVRSQYAQWVSLLRFAFTDSKQLKMTKDQDMF